MGGGIKPGYELNGMDFTNYLMYTNMGSGASGLSTARQGILLILRSTYLLEVHYRCR